MPIKETVLNINRKLREMHQSLNALELNALLQQPRGHFVSADKLHDAYLNNMALYDEDIHLTVLEVERLIELAPCPCGHCEYYAVELFEDGRFVVHHHTHGAVIRGNYKHKIKLGRRW